MKWKKLRPLLALPMAALLLFATACQEQTPSAANSGNGGVLVSQEESGTSENASESDPEKPYLGQTLSYRTYTYQKDEAIPVVYEFSVENVQIFDTYTDAGLPEEDFFPDFLTDQRFVLLDVHVKKTEGPERAGDDDWDTMEVVKLANQATKEADQKGEPYSSSPPCYFSGHSEDGYYYYWLDTGEEETFQVGWCLDDDVQEGREQSVLLTDTQGLALYVGLEDGLNGNGIPLRDP